MSTSKGVNSESQCKEKSIVGNVLFEVSQGYSTDAISYNSFTDDLEENVKSLVITSACRKNLHNKLKLVSQRVILCVSLNNVCFSTSK